MKKIKQHTQINKSTTYDDTLPSGATLESAATSLEDDLNAIRSQLEKIIGSGNWYDVYVAPAGTDELVKVSVDDTTPGFLLAKLSAGTGISITESSPGGNESLEISTTVVNTDNFVKVSAVDTTSDYLASKLVAGANVTLTPSGAGNETLTVAAVVPPDSDEAVKVSVDDTTPGFLDGKLLAGAGITFTVGSPAGNETLTIATSGVGTDEFVKASATDPVPDYLLNKLQAGANITITLDDAGLSEFVDIAGPTDVYIEGLAENHVTLKNAVDNQVAAGVASVSGIMDVTLANNSTWRFANSVPTLFLQWGVDGAGGTFFDTYGDLTRLNSGAVEIAQGVTVSASTGSPMEVGLTLGVISTPFGDLTISGIGGDLVFEDSYKAASTYGTPLVLADSAGEWSAFDTEFGEVSLLNAVVQAAGTGDNQVKVSANDATTGFLNGKLVAGTGISLTENADGFGESLTIANTGALTDQLVKVSVNDTTAGYLNGKLVDGRNISLVELFNGGNEDLSVRHNILPGTGTAIAPPDIVSSGLLGGQFGAADYVYHNRGIYREFGTVEPVQNDIRIGDDPVNGVITFLANPGSIVTADHYGVVAAQINQKGIGVRFYADAATFLPTSGNNYWKRFEFHFYVPMAPATIIAGIHNEASVNLPNQGVFFVIDADAGDMLGFVRNGSTSVQSGVVSVVYNTWLRGVIIACDSQSYLYILSEDGSTIVADCTPGGQPSLAGIDPLRPSINVDDPSSSGTTCFYLDWFGFDSFNKPA